MSFDISKYRNKYECDEHWELRKEFMERHKDAFPEERLVCLAQLYTNVTLLGCRYSPKLMKQIELLGSGLGKCYTKNKQKRLQRTFVKASDAAESKFKGVGTSARNYNEQSKKNVQCQNLRGSALMKQNTPSSSSRDVFLQNSSNCFQETTLSSYEIQQLKDFFIVLRAYCISPSAYSILSDSCNVSNVLLETQINRNCYQIFLNKIKIDEVKAQDIPQAKIKQLAAQGALKKLSHIVPLLLVKKPHNATEEVSTVSLGTACAISPSSLSEDNIGNKMLKKMGWIGGGLGKDKSGIINPVSVTTIYGRRGLGVKEDIVTPEFVRKIKNLLNDFAVNPSYPEEIAFSSEFSIEQRKKIHMLSRVLHLKSKSYGKGDDRYLVLAKQKKDFRTTIEKLKQEGGETSEFKLFCPGSLSSELESIISVTYA